MYSLGCHPPLHTCSVPRFRDAFSVLPVSQWVPRSLAHLKAPVLDQGQTSSCVGQSTATCFKRAWQLSGQPYREFNPYWIYALINGGQDQGGQLEDAVTALKTRGVATVTDAPVQLLYPQDLTQAEYTTASRFRALDVWWLQTWEEVGTALTLGFPVVTGTAVDQTFVTGRIQPNGIAYPTNPGAVAGYHAMESHGLSFVDSQPVFDTQNSWSEQFGFKGMCKLGKEHFRLRFTAFAIRASQDDPQEESTDPPVLRI